MRRVQPHVVAVLTMMTWFTDHQATWMLSACWSTDRSCYLDQYYIECTSHACYCKTSRENDYNFTISLEYLNYLKDGLLNCGTYQLFVIWEYSLVNLNYPRGATLNTECDSLKAYQPQSLSASKPTSFKTCQPQSRSP